MFVSRFTIKSVMVVVMGVWSLMVLVIITGRISTTRRQLAWEEVPGDGRMEFKIVRREGSGNTGMEFKTPRGEGPGDGVVEFKTPQMKEPVDGELEFKILRRKGPGMGSKILRGRKRMDSTIHSEREVRNESEARSNKGPAGTLAGPGESKKVVYRQLGRRSDGPSHSWWPHDPKCANLTVRYGRNISATLLHSYPRSGNTWVRYLLEGATGIFTSSIYKDFSLIRAGYLGERSKIWYRDTIVTKIHFVKHLVKFSTVPAITIIRNPARMLISLYNYEHVKNRRYKHTAVINAALYNTTEFHKFVDGALKKWLWTTRVCLEQTRRRLQLLYYEHIRDNPIRELRKMLEFLQVAPDEERLACLRRHTEGAAKSGQRNLNPFTQREWEKIDKAVKEVQTLLAKRGLPPLPDYSRYNN